MTLNSICLLFQRLSSKLFGTFLAYFVHMNKTWMLSILGITLALLTLLKMQEVRSLKPYFKTERAYKLENFQKARDRIPIDEQELLKLWESILTGRSAPLPRIMKEHYQKLGLNHLFTPSGFHLSAVMAPFMKVLKPSFHLPVIILIGMGLYFLPGLTALKRMLLIKGHQKVLGLKCGFMVALMMDLFFGSFQESTLSFTYSFLFLGIIYSGVRGLGLILWFFLGQMLLAYFQNTDISFLLLLFSPLLNLGFTILMPLLFLLSFPLWNWQLHLGIILLKLMQSLVNLCSDITVQFTTMEVNIVFLLMVGLFLIRKYQFILILAFFFSSGLNEDRARTPGMTTNEFVPRGEMIKTIYLEKEVVVYFEDGKCRMKLVRGFWWENCSPSKRGSRSRKLLKKLSYPS